MSYRSHRNARERLAKKKRIAESPPDKKKMQIPPGPYRTSLRFHDPLREKRLRRPARFECYKCAAPRGALVRAGVARARARAREERVGAEKNHVCIYISAGINHSAEKSRHKTQTGSQRGTAHPLNTQWPYVADVHCTTPSLLPP